MYAYIQGKGKITTYWLRGEKVLSSVTITPPVSTADTMTNTVPGANATVTTSSPSYNLIPNNFKYISSNNISNSTVNNNKSLNNNISNHNITSLTPLLQEDNG